MTDLLRRHWRTLAFVAGVAGLALTAWSQRDAIAAFDWSLDHRALAVAIALMALAPLAQAATYVVALRALGASAPLRGTLRVWARSFLLRYEPSGAVGFAHRVARRENQGASTPVVLTATAYEQLGALAAGALAAPLGFLAAGTPVPLVAVAMGVGAVVALLAVRPRWLGGWVARRLQARGVRTAGLLRGRVVWSLVAVNLAGWAATGAGAYTLVRALGVGGVDAYLLLGAFAMSWLIGALVPLAPGGLGLRDASLALSLGAALGAGPATALALALRLVSFAAELVAVAVAELVAAALRPRPTKVSACGRYPTTTRHPGPTIVVVPTYDEAEALPLFVERFAACGFELLVVDDASPDGTGAIADELAATRPWMHVLHRAEKDGLGRAYRAGFAWCLARGYSAVGQMDADLSHPPEKLAEMRAALDAGADLVIASRYLPGGATDGWPAARRALSRVGGTASRLLLGLPFSDLSGGFKLWRADALRAMDFDAMLADGYAFQVETTQIAYLMGRRIEELPFVFSERVAGASKMSLAISLEGIRVTLALRRAHRVSARHTPKYGAS